MIIVVLDDSGLKERILNDSIFFIICMVLGVMISQKTLNELILICALPLMKHPVADSCSYIFWLAVDFVHNVDLLIAFYLVARCAHTSCTHHLPEIRSLFSGYGRSFQISIIFNSAGLLGIRQ